MSCQNFAGGILRRNTECCSGVAVILYTHAFVESRPVPSPVLLLVVLLLEGEREGVGARPGQREGWLVPRRLCRDEGAGVGADRPQKQVR